MHKASKAVKIRNSRTFILSATVPSIGENPLWYTFDGQFRHYRLIGLDVVRGYNSVSLSFTFLILLLAVSWPAKEIIVRP